MKNLNSIITSHNNVVLNMKKDNNRLCNCRNQRNCPLQGRCLIPIIIYEATMKSEGNMIKYIGLLDTTFKERYRNHVKDFNNIK